MSLRNAKRRKRPRSRRGAFSSGRSTGWTKTTPMDDEAEEATNDAVDAATLLFHEPTDDELTLLKQMKTWAGTATRPA